MIKIFIVRPSTAHSAYKVAADSFAELAARITGADVDILTDDASLPDDSRPIVILGSDAVNHLSAKLYFERVVDGFDIRYNTDDYLIISAQWKNHQVLILSGGRPRAAIYAVYRYFELFCGCRYFWDGDRIPSAGTLPFDNIHIAESPRFEYRGLRYFAHRSLHRFQAEHWSLDDWKQEIDWILKKRLNLFMLRIGLDDLFQKAFPDLVSYPDPTQPLPEAGDGFDERTLFWSLEYRGELRRRLLQYAFERDLMHPEDCGTMTHWYSRTPLEYLEKRKPSLLSQKSRGYSEATGLVWDIRDDRNLNDYFNLTDTHIREYGKPELFHTIGLAERSYSDDREENMRLKLNVYRRIASHLKEKYPNAPLLIASWDLWMFYKPEEVRRLVAELDPSQSIILDYTSDTTNESNFTNWGVVGKFPWIFGIFSGYESNSEIRGYYELTNERLKIAKDDSYCKGLILWPELSHGDTFVGEYLAYNAWERETLSIDSMIEKYCHDRYSSKDCDNMLSVWQSFMPIVELRAWSMPPSLNQSYTDIFSHIFRYTDLDRDSDRKYAEMLASAAKLQTAASEILSTLSQLEPDDEFIRRDIFDIARTVIGRYIDFGYYRCCQLYSLNADEGRSNTDALLEMMKLTLELSRRMSDLLSLHEDFSMFATLEGMRAVTDTNPNFETTLKHNAECDYCRSYIYENAEYLYVPETEALFGEVRRALNESREVDRDAVRAKYSEIRKVYIETPLEDMQRKTPPSLSYTLKSASDIITAYKF